MTTHLVTGATGFVGGALVLELLKTTKDTVVAVVRPGPNETAEARLHASILHAARAYGLDPESVPLERLRGVAGDLTAPGCGVSAPVPRAHMLWHSAASLRYEDRHAEEISATNVGGTRHVLELARASGVEVANMISTAYVAGRADGRIFEAPIDSPDVNNHYERSKIEAEALARQADHLQVRILRPGIVVGHSKTLAATTFTGLYGYARQLMQFKGAMERMQKGLLARRPLRLRANPDLGLGLVPVDEVAVQAVHIGNSPTAQGVYNLTPVAPPRVQDCILAVTQALGFADPEFVEFDAPLEWLDEQLDARLDFYGSYVRGTKVFDRSRSDAALGDRDDLRRTLPCTKALVNWYFARLEAERAALPVSR